jgi:hypothetical protein
LSSDHFLSVGSLSNDHFLSLGSNSHGHFLSEGRNGLFHSAGRFISDDSHILLESVHLFKELEVCLFLSGDDCVGTFEFALSDFKVLTISGVHCLATGVRVGLGWESRCWECSCFFNLSLDDEISFFFSWGLLSKEFFLKALNFDTIVFLGSSFYSFSNNFIEDFLFSCLSLGQSSFEVFLFLEGLLLAVEFSSVTVLKDSVVLLNKLEGLWSSSCFNTDIWVRHNKLLVSESLKLSLIILFSGNSGDSGILNFLSSKSLSFVDSDGELFSVNFISCLLFVGQARREVVLLSFLSLSASLEIFLVVESSLHPFHFLLEFLLIFVFLSFFKLELDSLGIGFLRVRNNSFLKLFLKESWQFGEVLFELSELSFV